jgi:hypothetical protein
MPLEEIPIDQVQLNDLQRLLNDSVIENKQLDYKESLPQENRDAKREFLADVSAMANTVGGDILYGIVEQRDVNGKPTGLPEKIAGVPVKNWDTLRQGMEQAIRDGVEPRIQGIEIGKVDTASSQAVVIVRIPRSLQGPHMIKSRPSFYLRSVGGNSPMDVGDIRQSFLNSATVFERAETFRRSRIQQVVNGEAPVNIYSGAKLFLHIIPLGSQSFAVDFSKEQSHRVIDTVTPLHRSRIARSRLNFDGWVTFTYPQQNGLVTSYTQVFRDGSIEFCDAQLLLPQSQQGAEKLLLISPSFEVGIVYGTRIALQLIEQLNIPFPIAIFISLIGVRGYILFQQQGYFPVDFETAPVIDRDKLLLPGQIIESKEQKPEYILKPVFDTVWNSAGLRQSLAYDPAGQWIGG